jgi:hypothetical protein
VNRPNPMERPDRVQARQYGHDRVSDALDRLTNRKVELEAAAKGVIDAYDNGNPETYGRWADDLENAISILRELIQ